MKRQYLNYIRNIILPCFIYASIAGLFSGLVVFFYKLLITKIISYSADIYSFVNTNLYYIPLLILVLALLAYISYLIVKRESNAQGGGIPTAIGILRGVLPFKWISTLFSTLFSSLITFFSGLGLGNEGPSILIGTACGKAVTCITKRDNGWDRYIMTGGAASAFAVITNSPLSSIMFALEEFHHRFSPMLIFTCFISVSFSMMTSITLCNLMDIDNAFLKAIVLPEFSISYAYIPFVVGIVCGILAKLYILLSTFLDKYVFNPLKNKVPNYVILILVFVITGIIGVFFYGSISTGHGLIEGILDNKYSIGILFLLLLLRPLLTLSASKSNATGGLFIPYLAIGAIIGAILADIFISCGAPQEYYSGVILLTMTAFLASMLRAPLTSMVFAIEALYFNNTTNILFAVYAVGMASVISEILKVESANDIVLNKKVKKMNEGKTKHILETTLIVTEKSFVEGKMIRDILWPSSCLVLSIKRRDSFPRMDRDGENVTRVGDELTLRIQTYDIEDTKERLFALFNHQDIVFNEIQSHPEK